MKKIAVIGHFGGEKEMLDGQTIKTKILWEELGKTNEFEMMKIDTYGWRSNPIRLFKNCRRAVRQSETVLMLPDYNGFLTLSVLLPLFNRNNKAKLIYIVVGGWLPVYLKEHPFYLGRAKKFSTIVVETEAIKMALEKLGLKNVSVVPNFKRLDYTNKTNLGFEKPFSFCYFSRVIPEKGIKEAVEAVKAINLKSDKSVCTFDIYGPVGADYKEDFNELICGSEDTIRYKGIVPFDKSVETLVNYYAMLFPTLYYAECLPGTVIDAYASAVPVIAFNWSSGADVVKHGKTGWICEENTVASLIKTIEFSMANVETVKIMKRNCLTEAEQYSPEICLPKIIKIIQGD